MMPPSMTNILKAEDIENAKKDFIKRLNDIKFKDQGEDGVSKTKAGIIDWANQENTLFSGVDVDEMIKNVLTDNI